MEVLGVLDDLLFNSLLTQKPVRRPYRVESIVSVGADVISMFSSISLRVLRLQARVSSTCDIRRLHVLV